LSLNDINRAYVSPNSIQDLLDVSAKNFLIFNQPSRQAFSCFKKLNRSRFYMKIITVLFTKELGKNLAALQKKINQKL
jgi:hypothetical protein